MRNLKKVLSLALALVMLLGMMMVGAGAATTTSADLSEANQEAIAVLKATKVMTNKRYGDPVTRAEAAKMALTIYNPDLAKGVKNTTDSAYFKDVKNHWAAGYIDLCKVNGIISGETSTKFNPNGSVTGYELAKMILVAMGSDKKYTGSTWETKVMQDVIAAGLGADTKISQWNKPVTRLQAAQLTFNGMTKSLSGSDGFTVGDSNGVVLPAYANMSMTLTEAAILANLTGNGAKPIPAQSNDTLQVKNFPDLTQDTKDDGLGHKINTWKMGEKEIWAASTYTSTAAKTFTYQTITDADLKGVEYTASVVVTTDGNAAAAADWSTKTTGDTAVKGLGKDNNIVELFAGTDGKVNKVIVTNVYIGVVASVAEAKEDTKRTVTLSMNSTIDSTLGSAKTFENEDLQKDDVVLFTVGEKDNTAYVASCTVADSFVGQMTRYSAAKKTLTIGGVTYDLANDYADPSVEGLAVTVANLTDTSKVAAKTDYNFYTDAKGKIVAAKAVGEAPVELNYAVVDAIVYVAGATSGSGLSQTAGTDSMEARLVMTDGSAVIAKLSSIKVNGVAKTFSTAPAGTTNIQIEKKVQAGEAGNLTATANAIDGLDMNTDATKNTALTGKVVTYTYDEKSDSYSITYTATASSGAVTYTGFGAVTAAGKTDAPANTATVTVKGTPAFNNGTDTTVGNNKTIYLIKTNGAPGQPAKFTPYVGYGNVETVTLTGQVAAQNAATATANVAYATKDGVAAVVYIDATLTPAYTTVAVGTPAAPVVEVVYILNTSFETDASGKDPVKVYDAIVDGVVGNVNVKSDVSISSPGLYTVTKTDGVVTVATAIADASGETWKMYTVKGAQGKPANGVLKTTTATATFGYNEETQVFMVDADGKVVKGATVESMKPVAYDANNGDPINGVKYNVWISVVKDTSVIKTIYIQTAVDDNT